MPKEKELKSFGPHELVIGTIYKFKVSCGLKKPVLVTITVNNSLASVTVNEKRFLISGAWFELYFEIEINNRIQKLYFGKVVKNGNKVILEIYSTKTPTA